MKLVKRELLQDLCRNRRAYLTRRYRIEVMTLHVSKRLNYPVLALVGAGRMPANAENKHAKARRFLCGNYAGKGVGVCGERER